MSLHHVAIGTPAVERLGEFYAQIPGVREESRQHTKTGELRSIWLRAGETVLMIERAENREAPRALVFSASGVEPDRLEQFLKGRETDRTAFTAYFRDPDGNRLGLSAYPQELAAGSSPAP